MFFLRRRKMKNDISYTQQLIQFGIKSPNRVIKLIKNSISYQKLDLSGLTILTEAANGYYSLTSIISAMAGADKIFAITQDSRYASIEHVKKQTMLLAEFAGVGDKITIITTNSILCLLP